MRRTLLATLLLAGVAALPSVPARAAVSADINVHLGERYPVQFRRAPRVYAIPRTDISYVPDRDYDMYQSDDRWYINDSGAWYCADSYRGPFLRVSYQSVPRRILQMPWGYRHQARGYWSQDRSWQADNWRNGGQNDNWRQQSQNQKRRGHDQGDYHGGNNGNGHGHGHGQGNGRGDDRDNDD